MIEYLKEKINIHEYIYILFTTEKSKSNEIFKNNEKEFENLTNFNIINILNDKIEIFQNDEIIKIIKKNEFSPDIFLEYKKINISVNNLDIIRKIKYEDTVVMIDQVYSDFLFFINLDKFESEKNNS